MDAERNYHDRQWLERHLAEERHESELLGEIREALFGAQDGIVSTLAVVATVSGATGDRTSVLVAGIATALAGVFSMGAGEYLSSKSQREIYLAQIQGEREEVEHRPEEAAAEVALMFEQEGMAPDAARRVASEIGRYPEVLLRTMVEKELGIAVDGGRSAFQGALVMGLAFGAAALVPLLPFVFLPIAAGPAAAVVTSVVATFAIGVVKSRWTRKSPLRSGAEVVVLAAVAGIAGFFFGTLLPGLLGFEVPAV